MSGNKMKIPGFRVQGSGFRVKALIILVSALCLVPCALCQAEEQFVYDAKGKRNPFIPLVTSDGRLLKLDKEESQGGLLIEGIIYDKQGRSFAIVNGAVVGIGDIVADYQVLKIEENKVIFIKEGQAFEVEMKKEEEQSEKNKNF